MLAGLCLNIIMEQVVTSPTTTHQVATSTTTYQVVHTAKPTRNTSWDVGTVLVCWEGESLM